jgi:hypothetical protein
VACSTRLFFQKCGGGGIALAGLEVRGYGDDRLHPIGLVFGGLEGNGCANRNAEHQNRLLRLVMEPFQDGPQIVDLAGQ